MKTYFKIMTIMFVVIALVYLTACKRKRAEFKVPHIPTIYGNNLSKVIAFDLDDIFIIGSFGFAARTNQGSEIRHENSSKKFWQVQNTGFEDELNGKNELSYQVIEKALERSAWTGY